MTMRFSHRISVLLVLFFSVDRLVRPDERRDCVVIDKVGRSSVRVNSNTN